MSAPNRSHMILASVPLWPIAWMLMLACVIRATFGFWPGHGPPNKLRGPIVVLEKILLPLLLCAPLAVLGSVGVAIHAWYARRWNWCLPLTVGCFVAFVAWLRIDPGGLFEWLMD
jgi:hypothetical protein